jgi:hypothetical protein
MPPIFREPLEKSSQIHTFTYHVNEFCQFQWDYEVLWSGEDGPRINIWSYRCFQRESCSTEWIIVDETTENVPMSSGLLKAISHDAGQRLYDGARVFGSANRVPEEYLTVAKDVFKRRCGMLEYRTLMQKA